MVKLFLLCLSHKYSYEIKEGSWIAQSASYIGYPHPPLPSPPCITRTDDINCECAKDFFKKNFKARHQIGPDTPSATEVRFIGSGPAGIYTCTLLGLNLGPFVRYHGPRVGYTSEPLLPGTMEKEKSVQTISTPKSIIHP
jgi:hypothetical protein